MTERRIERRLAKLEELEAQIRELEKEADAIKDELKADMEAKGVEEMATSNHVIRWKEVATNRLDGKALKQAHPRIYAQFLKSSVTRRFTVA